MPLPASTDVLVVGAGLAGACVALALRDRAEVTVIDAGRPASGASGAAAGLVNPFMGRKAKPAWRRDEALAALDRLVEEADPDLLVRSGVLRPAASETQVGVFRDRAEAHPDIDWLGPEAAANRWPAVAAPHGALDVHRGGHVRIPDLVEAALEASGADVHLGVRLEAIQERVAITDVGAVRCRRLVLALGDGAHRLPATASLPLHRVKGQTVRLGAALPAGHPAVSGNGYVVPEAAGAIVGSTFEHHFDHTEADPALDAVLVEMAARLVPSLASAEVVE
ncbi:MAG: FAD-dependent oxidoreductase, partial [Bacteroidota bacterium]